MLYRLSYTPIRTEPDYQSPGRHASHCARSTVIETPGTDPVTDARCALTNEPLAGGRAGRGPGLCPVLSLISRKSGLETSVDYSMILETTPAPTVLPPSRMAKRSFSSMAIGLISSTRNFRLSPGITISVPSGS